MLKVLSNAKAAKLSTGLENIFEEALFDMFENASERHWKTDRALISKQLKCHMTR